jgi:hypothetical protein
MHRAYQHVGDQWQQPGQRDLSRGGAVCLRDVGDHWVGANLLVLLTSAPERTKRLEANKDNW